MPSICFVQSSPVKMDSRPPKPHSSREHKYSRMLLVDGSSSALSLWQSSENNSFFLSHILRLRLKPTSLIGLSNQASRVLNRLSRACVKQPGNCHPKGLRKIRALPIHLNSHTLASPPHIPSHLTLPLKSHALQLLWVSFSFFFSTLCGLSFVCIGYLLWCFTN